MKKKKNLWCSNIRKICHFLKILRTWLSEKFLNGHILALWSRLAYISPKSAFKGRFLFLKTIMYVNFEKFDYFRYFRNYEISLTSPVKLGVFNFRKNPFLSVKLGPIPVKRQNFRKYFWNLAQFSARHHCKIANFRLFEVLARHFEPVHTWTSFRLKTQDLKS